jgi:hypothetical protein
MKRTLSIVFTIFIFSAILAFFFNKPKFEKDTDQFGRAFNAERIKLGVPVIEEHWVAHHAGSTGALWMNKSHRIQSQSAHHSSKRTRIENKKWISDEDDFDRFVNDSVSHLVVYIYNVDSNLWKCTLSIHRFNSYPPSRAQTISLTQADSIIGSWGLKR